MGTRALGRPGYLHRTGAINVSSTSWGDFPILTFFGRVRFSYIMSVIKTIETKIQMSPDSPLMAHH